MEKLSKYDTYLISALAHGATITQVRTVLRFKGLKPNSESSVDKRLKALRKQYQCLTTIQLVYTLREHVIPIDLKSL